MKKLFIVLAVSIGLGSVIPVAAQTTDDQIRTAAYEEPENEPSVKAVVGHMYLVHTRDWDNNYYVLFRVERPAPGREC